MGSQNSLQNAESKTHKTIDIDVITEDKINVENEKISSRNSVTLNDLEINVHSAGPKYLNVSKNNSTEKSPSPVLNLDVLNSNSDDSNLIHISPKESSSSSKDESPYFNSNPNIPIGEEEINVKSSFCDKLHALLLCHTSNTTKAFKTELLRILREEGYKELPKSAATLLKSNKYTKIIIKRMEVESRHKRHKQGHYVYFGIAENLRRIISPTVYAERIIK